MTFKTAVKAHCIFALILIARPVAKLLKEGNLPNHVTAISSLSY